MCKCVCLPRCCQTAARHQLESEVEYVQFLWMKLTAGMYVATPCMTPDNFDFQPCKDIRTFVEPPPAVAFLYFCKPLHFTSLHTFVVAALYRDLPSCLRILLAFHLVVVVSLLMADSVREREENRSGSRPRCAIVFPIQITHASVAWTFLLVKKYARVRAANYQYKSLHFIL